MLPSYQTLLVWNKFYLNCKSLLEGTGHLLRSENKVLNLGSGWGQSSILQVQYKVTPECFLNHLLSLDSSSVGIEEILDPVYVPNSFVEENIISSVLYSIFFRCFFSFHLPNSVLASSLWFCLISIASQVVLKNTLSPHLLLNHHSSSIDYIDRTKGQRWSRTPPQRTL